MLCFIAYMVSFSGRRPPRCRATCFEAVPIGPTQLNLETCCRYPSVRILSGCLLFAVSCRVFPPCCKFLRGSASFSLSLSLAICPWLIGPCPWRIGSPWGKREAIRRRHMKQARGCGTPFCASQPFIRGAYADANGLTGSQGFWRVWESVCGWKCKSRATQIIGDKLGLQTRGLTAYGCSRGTRKATHPRPRLFRSGKSTVCWAVENEPWACPL